MQDKLQKFHRYALSRLVWTLSILVGSLLTYLWMLAPDNLFTRLLAPLTSAAVVGGIFLFSEKLVRQSLWRVAYPELDFQGRWQGYTEYCFQYLEQKRTMIQISSLSKSIMKYVLYKIVYRSGWITMKQKHFMVGTLRSPLYFITEERLALDTHMRSNINKGSIRMKNSPFHQRDSRKFQLLHRRKGKGH